jgi:nucleoside-diphosphate-sugar epimerase/uncharacterized membrane protein
MSAHKEIVIVTGSSGLIGSAVVNRFAEHYSVIGFDAEGPPHPPPAAECVCVDLASDESVKEGLARVLEGYGERIASVIHLAAYYDFSGEPSEKYEEITVRGTQRLLRGLKDFQVEQFVFSSTMLVHAPCEPGQRINEDWPLEPKWDYPKSKVKTEELIRSERGDIPAVMLRIAGVYTDRCHSIPLAHQMQRIYERWRTSHVFPGATAHGQAFIHLEDLVEALLLVAERRAKLPPELTLLLGEPETLAYDELQHVFGRLIHGEEWETREIPKALAKTGAWIQDEMPLVEDPFIKPWMIDLADDHYELDITRARQTLGWEPKRSLGETLPKMVDALKADPLAWYKQNKIEPPSELKETSNGHGGSSESHEVNGKKHDTHDKHQGTQSVDHNKMMIEQHEQWLWRDFVNILLGVWLMSGPFMLGLSSTGLMWSDFISGALITLFGLLSLFPRFELARWGICFTGIWLLFAPLVFWSPDASGYTNDTLIGSLVIAFSVLIPMMPGKAHHMVMMQPGPDLPRGWTYNPSTWQQRAPIIALAFVGFFCARYLAAFQLGYINRVWDPFFVDGTRSVLQSDVSRAWPISDAGLGALSYMLEALSGFMGGVQRWRTMPWMVAMFGFLVVPLGVTSIVLVILQPLMVGAWCTLCLVTAIAMLIMVPLAVDEVVAMFQFLAQAHREGKPMWRTFWIGGTLDVVNEDKRTPRLTAPPAKFLSAMVWGVNVPWTLLVSSAVGIWLMFAPSVFATQGRAEDSDHLVGALVITFAVIAMAEVTRAARLINILFGAWIILAPWLLSGSTTGAKWIDVIAGVALIALSIPRGRIKECYGGWDPYII